MSFIVQNICTASDECMPLFRRLQQLLHRHRIALQMRWLPSAMNVHDDRLSRTWDPRDIELSRAALQFLKDIYRTIPGLSKPIFAYRRLAGHPVAQRKTTLAAFDQTWSDGHCRFFDPPIDMMSLTVSKIAREGAKGILIVPDWPNTIWYPAVQDVCGSWEPFSMKADESLCGARSIRNNWRLVVGVIGGTNQRIEYSLHGPRTQLRLLLRLRSSSSPTPPPNGITRVQVKKKDEQDRKVPF